MANVDAPTGFKPVGHLLGLDWSAALRQCYLPSTDGTAYYVYDLVDIAGSADATGAYATITKTNTGLATYPVFGSIVGFTPDSTTALDFTYRKASTNRYALVCVDPFVIYEAQGETGAVFAATQVGLNVCMIATHSGSTTTGLSGEEIDTGTTSTPAANATFPLTLLGAVDKPFNDISLVNAKWHVMVTMHRLLSNYINTAYFGALGIS